MNESMFTLLSSRPQRITYENLQEGQEQIATPSRSPVPFFITRCGAAKIDLQPAKAAAVQIERSSYTHITVGVTVGAIEVISSENVSVDVKSAADTEGTVTVDDSTAIKIDVPLAWTIYTTRCKDVVVNGQQIFSDSDLPDGLTPFRLRTAHTNGVWRTVQVNLYGDALLEKVRDDPVR
ncbi:hypothetical protein HDU86_005713 [Geranomyces michiganensis]|nr:hypothetical protein HDU86_005713 [Geranomyces michiganensis]